MGTVGLSFGSPTGGTGFDVSTTVASIVSNLQNVETPWKTQLSKLEKQDTVISNLGTLLSAVSTDLSQLTDVTGIMAQKTGSSSDTSVVELLSATSSATAGTHTVVVKNLAATSSGYLDMVSSSSDTLSGSITIQVGSTSKTITLDTSNGTLAGLAKAINASGAGVTASVLTDSSGSRLSLVSGTSGANGQITISSNSITDTTTGTALNYHGSVTGKDASLVVDGVTLTSASNTVTNLIPGLTFQLLAPSSTESDNSLESVQVVIANDNTAVESTINSFVSDYNALVSAINTQEGNDSSGNAEPLFGSPTLSLLQQQLMSNLNLQNPSGYLDAVSATSGTTLSGSITLQVGSGTAQKVTVDSTDINGLATAINNAQIGVTAAVTTKNGESTLTLSSQTAGSSGALTVTSSLTATSDTALSFTDSGYTSTTADSGTLGTVASASDTLSGSITLQVGSGTAQTITLDSSNNTVAGLAAAINDAKLGVNATVNEAGTGITLTSGTTGSAGALTITSNLLDTTNTTSTALSYNSSSDISTLANLGITISTSDNGTLSFDVSTLDSVLNSDFSGVVGFFQNVNSWGNNFASVLNYAGTSSSKGMLALALSADSSSESTLNANISRQESLISAESKSLTAVLNSANEILQEIPMQLSEVNMLYSAITGYNQNS